MLEPEANSLSELTNLLAIASEKQQGPVPSFTNSHLLLVLLEIGESGTIGREALAKRVELGLGAIRTILRKMKEKRYLKASGYGSSLTTKGKQAYSLARQIMPKLTGVQGSSITVGKEQVAVLIRGKAAKVKGGIEQRDAAIRMGASGATTYIIRDSRFTVPKGSQDCEADFPSKVWKTLRKELLPAAGDTIIVCGSDDRIKSTLGAINAALTII
jgi:hypothetical protein